MKTTVIHEKTVLLISSIVAQKQLAAVAVPYCFMPLFSPVMVAVVAAVGFHCSSSWEVIFTKSLSWWYSRWTPNSFAAAVLPDQCLCQVNSEVLYR